MPFYKLREAQRARNTQTPAATPKASTFDRFKASPVRKRVWSVGRLLVLIGSLALVYGLFFLAAMRVATHAREVRVPDVRGKSVAEAGAALKGAGLALNIDPLHRVDPKVPEGHVLSQDPQPGTVVRRQRSVRIRVSDGQRDPVLPAVIGEAERTADTTLEQIRVQVSARAEIRSGNYPAGTVVAQTPPPRSRSSTVALLINRGDEGMSYVMPDLIGTLGERAAQVLRSQNFRVSVTPDVPYPGLPPGIVVRQTPHAGFQVGFGDAISIEISR